uniref:LIM zinc-binding domain-containing protein n=1 Tax=Anopheles christyi TaxID=43041 RepID=A0A182JUY9_9DIPT
MLMFCFKMSQRRFFKRWENPITQDASDVACVMSVWMAFHSRWTSTIKFIVSTIIIACSHQNVRVAVKVSITPMEGTEDTVRVVAMDKDFHVDCYICEECGMQLTDESDKRCYPYEGRLMCRSCHIQKISIQDRRGRILEPVSATYQYMG